MADEQKFNWERYGDLLREVKPCLIESTEEHERLLASAEKMLEKGDAIGPEEERLLAMLALLIEAFEAGQEEEDEEEEEGTHHPAAPHETLVRLLQARNLEIQDITDIFGNPRNARDVIAGTRAITRGEAKALGRFFQVPPKLFQL